MRELYERVVSRFKSHTAIFGLNEGSYDVTYLCFKHYGDRKIQYEGLGNVIELELE
jgi:hypothetical protein